MSVKIVLLLITVVCSSVTLGYVVGVHAAKQQWERNVYGGEETHSYEDTTSVRLQGPERLHN